MTGKPTKRQPAGRGLLPSSPNRASKLAGQIVRALEPKSPLDSVADLAKKIGRPMDCVRGSSS